ncbi:MAG: glycoside hydrolase family 130 protein [Victivallaceae bacterium]|nr:glycoside hydrolase family 130 protein [Victivallaceae bacterium]
MKKFESNNVIIRYPGNPVMSAEKVPYDATLIFNAGVTKFNGKYVMVFRNDYNFEQSDYAKGKNVKIKTNIGIAFSNDGLNWDVKPEPCQPVPLNDEIRRCYDPRLTVIDGRCYICFAVDTAHGIRGGIAVTDDFDKFEILSLSTPDNRNMVLFPEKINGEYLRLERPFPVYGRHSNESFDCWMSYSPDLCYWGKDQLLLGAEDVSFCNCKIGPAAPPIKTPQGWLTTFHAVWTHDDSELDSWHGGWDKEYLAGLMLLDLDNPNKIIGIYQDPLLLSETDHELKGFRGSVIFPGGMILEDSGEVKIYYGAADTVECLATAHIDDLIDLCLKDA